uniref:BTB domain-containing protein n=1 Tax=Strigamia maritima TaxID=126957 RepID=T1JPJ0_STRMM
MNPPMISPSLFLVLLKKDIFPIYLLYQRVEKSFKVHKTILMLNGVGMDLNQRPLPLSGLPDDVLCTILHYIYSECLPDDLTEETARNTQRALIKVPGFSRLSELCEIFLKNTALKQQIDSLVSDMHACANRIIDYFNGKGINEPNGSPPGGIDNLRSNPAKLCLIVKQAIRESAVAGAKLLLVCDLYSKRKHELSRQERHDIIKNAKSSLPEFMDQLRKFLEVIRQTFGDLCSSQRQNIACYLVPEIESTLDLVSELAVDTKSALEHMINVSGPGDKSGCPERNKRIVGEVLSRSLKNVSETREKKKYALHMRELMKLKSFNEKITISFTNLLQKRENFNDMTSANKVRSIANNLACLDEVHNIVLYLLFAVTMQVCWQIPVFLLRLEEIMSALKHKLTWKEWKYYFKLGTSKVAWMLQKLVSHRSMLFKVVLQACDLVQRDQFTQSMIALGLLEVTQPSDTSASSRPVTQPNAKPTSNQLNLVDSLSSPPLARNSSLARQAGQLFRHGQATDMVFEIESVQDETDTVIDHTGGEPVNRSTRQREVQTYEIHAHRVIVAARCDWFRRALLSGMKESIDRKIIIHDTNLTIFRLFLEYLYEGQVETSKLSIDQLADIMLLCDQFEVDTLKQICEQALLSHIDKRSALFLLGIADQLNVKSLRGAALYFVAMNPDIIDSEVFFQLPEEVQSEVEVELAKMEPWCVESGRVEKALQKSGSFLPAVSPSSVSSSLEEVEEMTANLRLTKREPLSDSSSLEELPLTQDSTRLEACIAQLRDIVGSDVKHEELVRISLAADYDANRALNFFYAS